MLDNEKLRGFLYSRIAKDYLKVIIIVSNKIEHFYLRQTLLNNGVNRIFWISYTKMNGLLVAQILTQWVSLFRAI